MTKQVNKTDKVTRMRTNLVALAAVMVACLFGRPALAANVDTTPGAVIMADNPANTYFGSGTLQIKDDGFDGRIRLATGNGIGVTNFEMTGGTITIDSGVIFENGGWQKGVWTNNKASMTVNGTLDLWDGNAVNVNGLNGSGTITHTTYGNFTQLLTVGVNGGGGTFSGIIQEDSTTRSVGLHKTGGGIQALTGTSNTYSGGTTIDNGFLRVNADGSLGATGGTVTIRDGGVLQNNNSNVNLDANRSINLANGEGRIRSGWANRTITVNGQITGPGDLRIVNDSSVVVLANSTNDYTGNTIIGGDGSNGGDGGTNATARLTLGANDVIPHGFGNGNVIFDAGVNRTGILNLNGNNETINGLSVASGNGIVENTTGTATLSVGRGAADSTYAGLLRDNGGVLALTKLGGGTFTLQSGGSNNTYSGLTTVDNGILEVGGGAGFGGDGAIQGNIQINTGGTFRLLEFNVINNASNITIDNGGVFDLKGNNEKLNEISATGAGLGNGAITNSGTGSNVARIIGTINNNGFSVGGTGDIEIQGSVNGNNRLTKVDGNTVALSGTDDNISLQGTVNGGVLELAKDGSSGAPLPNVHALGGGTHIVNNGGTLRLAGTGDDQIFNGSMLNVNSGGVLDLNGRNEQVNTMNIAGTGIAGSGAIINSDAAASTLTGTIASTDFTLGGTGDITINGDVGNAAVTNTLTKIDGNTLSLGGAADNSRLLLNVQAGRVELNKASNGSFHAVGGISDIATDAVVQLTGGGGDQIFNGNDNTTFGDVSMSGGILALGGLSETIAELNGTGTVQNFTGSSTLTVGNSNRSSAFDGTIKGGNDINTALVKIGTGTFAIGGADDNAFLTASVQGGVLELGKTSSGTVHAVSGITDIATGATVKLTGTGGDQIFAGNTTANRGLVNMSGGTLDLYGNFESIAELTGTGNVTNTAATAATFRVGEANGNSQFDGTISNGTGGLSLVKTGGGVFTTTGVNTYAGTTTVQSPGILIVDGEHNGAGNYTIESGATLGGEGTINLASGQSITVSNMPGIVSPGNAGSGYAGPDPTYSAGADMATVGTLIVNAGDSEALALSMGGILQIDLLSPTLHDLLDIATGTVSIGGINPTTLEINGETDLSLLDFRGLGFITGDRVDFLLADQTIGDFDSFPSNVHFTDAGGQQVVLGNDGTALFIQAVPEPSSLLIWAAIAIGLVAFSWRLRKSKHEPLGR